MNHLKINFACLFTVLFLTANAYSQSDIHKEIRPLTTDKELELLISELAQEGISLKVTKIKRSRGKIRKLGIRVDSGGGSFRHNSAPFSGLVIERNENLCIGVKSINP